MNKTIFVLLFLVCASGIFAQVKSGLIVNGGGGCLSNVKLSNDILKQTETPFSFSDSYKMNASVGYKFRIQPPAKRFFYDIDLHLGFKRANLEYTNNPYQFNRETGIWEDLEPATTFGGRMKETFYYFSINPSWNYNIIKGLHAGVGIEPTLYSSDANGLKFDTPVTARIGYDFKFVDIAFTYKAGLLNTIDSNSFSSGRFNDWQIQVFIPF